MTGLPAAAIERGRLYTAAKLTEVYRYTGYLTAATGIPVILF